MSATWDGRALTSVGCGATALLCLLFAPKQAHADQSGPTTATEQQAASTQVSTGGGEPTERPLTEPCGLTRTSPWHLDIAIGTVVPMDVGGRIQLQGPYRIFLSLGLGIMPDAYVDIVNATATGLDLYHESKAKLIKDGLHDAITFRSALGWFPWEDWGFYGSAGYAFQGLGGRSSPGELLRAATDIDPPVTGVVDVDVEADVHLLTVDFGYRWFLARNLFFQAGIGGEFTLASNSRIEPEFGLRSIGPVDRFVRSGEERLDDILESKYHHPTVTLLLGARGF